jgi:thiamine biosynthesis lipoprotein
MLAFRFEGKSYGHILDPRSGRPAEGVLSATVVAPNAMLADALSTAFYVLGLEKTREYCRTRPQIGAVLICPIRRQGGVEIHPINLSAAELTLCGESAVG